MKKSFGGDFLIYGVSASLSKLVGLFLVPIYARIFSTGDYGSYDLINTVIAFLTILGSMQLESAVTRYYFSEKSEYERNTMVSTALWSMLFFSLILYLILFFFSGSIIQLLFKKQSESLITVIKVAGLLLPLVCLRGLFTVIIRFKKKPIQFLAFQSIQMIFTIGVTVFLILYLKTGIIGIFWGQISGMLIAIIMMGYYLRSSIILSYSRFKLKKMFRYSIPLIPAVAGNWANSYMNRFVMLGYLSVSEIGIFAIAMKIASVFSIGGQALRMAWGPFFWEKFENDSEHKVIFRELQKYISIITFTLVIIFTLFSRDILVLFTSSQYYYAANIVGVIALSFAITNIINPITAVGPGIAKRTEYNTLIYFISVGTNIGSLFLFVPRFGIAGVTFSLLLSSAILLILSWNISERLYRIGFIKSTFMSYAILSLAVIIVNYNYRISLQLKLITIFILIVISTFYFSKNIKLLKNIFGWNR